MSDDSRPSQEGTASQATSLDVANGAPSRVRAAAKFFFQGDQKFFVKGITYGPFKPDRDGNFLGRPEQVDIDLRLMRELTRRLANRCAQPISVTVSSASSMPAANHEKNAGGQLNGLTPNGASKGMSGQPKLTTATAAITPDHCVRPPAC